MRYLVLLLLLILPLTSCGGSYSGHPSAPSKQSAKSGGIKTKPDALAERQIVLQRAHTDEKFSGVYYKNGAYLPDAMVRIRKLMRDQRTGEVGPIDPELIDFLVDIRTRLGLPPTVVFEILSGYRSRSSNEALAQTNKAVAKESLHMYGWAVDFRLAGVKGLAISEIAKTMQRGGASNYPSDNHVHVDIGNIRSWDKGPSLPPP